MEFWVTSTLQWCSRGSEDRWRHWVLWSAWSLPDCPRRASCWTHLSWGNAPVPWTGCSGRCTPWWPSPWTDPSPQTSPTPSPSATWGSSPRWGTYGQICTSRGGTSAGTPPVLEGRQRMSNHMMQSFLIQEHGELMFSGDFWDQYGKLICIMS